MLQEEIERRPRVRIAADFEERNKYVPEELLEVLHHIVLLVDITGTVEHKQIP